VWLLDEAWFVRYLCAMSAIATEKLPDASGHFGPYGGRFVPETLMHPLQELEQEYFVLKKTRISGRTQVLPERVLRATDAALLRRAPTRNLVAQRFISSGKTCSIPARTRSIIVSDRSCWLGAWANANYCRNRRGPAWGSDRYRCSHVRVQMCHLYGRSGLRTAGAQCVSDENARAEVVPVKAGQQTLKKPSMKRCAIG